MHGATIKKFFTYLHIASNYASENRFIRDKL